MPCPVPPNDSGTGPINVSLNLPAGEHLRYDLSATVQGLLGAQIQNTASLLTPNGVLDRDTVNNCGTASILVVPNGIFIDGFESASHRLSVPAAEAARMKAD